MNILITGLGSIAQKHIKAISNNHFEACIYALRHQKESPVIDSVTNIYSFDEIKFPVDFVIISNPTSKHYETILKCISLNCPLFIEKPLFHDLKQDFNELSAAIREGNIKTYIACVLRFHPVIKHLKQMVQENKKKINEVNIYCGSFLPDWRPGADYKNSYSAQKSLGGGVHLDLIHEIDYAFYIFGKPISVKKITRSSSSLYIDSVDFATYSLIYDTFVINVVLNYYRIGPKREIEILFEDCTVKGDLLNSTITDQTGRMIFDTKFEWQQLYDEQMNYFYTHDAPMNHIEEAWEVLKLVL